MAKQKPRAGKVVRLNTKLLKLLAKHRVDDESWSKTLLRLLGDPDSTMWTLPSKLYITRAEATGTAVQEAAREGVPLEDMEHPIRVGERF